MEMIAYVTVRDGNPGSIAKGSNKFMCRKLTPLQKDNAPDNSSANAEHSQMLGIAMTAPSPLRWYG